MFWSRELEVGEEAVLLSPECKGEGQRGWWPAPGCVDGTRVCVRGACPDRRRLRPACDAGGPRRRRHESQDRTVDSTGRRLSVRVHLAGSGVTAGQELRVCLGGVSRSGWTEHGKWPPQGPRPAEGRTEGRVRGRRLPGLGPRCPRPSASVLGEPLARTSERPVLCEVHFSGVATE